MIFIDTTVWVGAADNNDDLHESATKVIDAVTSGSLPLALTTDFIIDETVTIPRRKAFGANGKALYGLERIQKS